MSKHNAQGRKLLSFGSSSSIQNLFLGRNKHCRILLDMYWRGIYWESRVIWTFGGLNIYKDVLLSLSSFSWQHNAYPTNLLGICMHRSQTTHLLKSECILTRYLCDSYAYQRLRARLVGGSRYHPKLNNTRRLCSDEMMPPQSPFDQEI